MPRLLLLLLPFFALVPSTAAEWETLEGVRLIDRGYADGDSFRVRHQGKEYTFRIFYVDAPETSNSYPERVRGQARAFSLSASRTLELGEEAAAFARAFLARPFTVHTDWSDGWGEQTRYRAVIERDGTDLAGALVRNGLARVSGFVPDSAWPGLRESVWEYRNRLQAWEKEARREGRGGWGESRSAEDGSAGNAPGPPPTGLIDINTATPGQLEDLPGIGPVLAGRIAELRPFRALEDLDQVYGISARTVDGIRDRATVIPPPLFPNTADYLRENSRYYLNAPVRLAVADLRRLERAAPEGFAVAEAVTVHPEGRGGSMPLFAPTEKMEAARARFAASAEPLDVRAWLRDIEGEIVLVVY